MDYGTCDGMIINQALKSFPTLKKIEKIKKIQNFQMEKILKRKKSKSFSKKLKKMNFKNTVIFTHNNIIKALFCNLTGLKIYNYH